MVSFYVYDIALFAIFMIALVIFFYKKRKNFSIDGPMYLYRTSFGLKIIDWFGKKHANWLRPLQYVVIVSGYGLMITMVYMLIKVSYYYLTVEGLAAAIKVPVVFPLIPYLPEIFNIDFLPPLYFTYWIIILAVVAIPHEFAHGIFAKLNKVRIKSTGFGFLRIFKWPTPFLAAFVEQDDKQMNKASKFGQLAILAAGTFANVLFTIFFALVFWLFFTTAYAPGGVVYQDYANGMVNTSYISEINGVNLSQVDFTELSSIESKLVSFKTNDGEKFYASPQGLSATFEGEYQFIHAYFDSPAINANLSKTIVEFNGVEVKSRVGLLNLIRILSEGDKVPIKTINADGEVEESEITLGEFEGNAFLGVAFTDNSRGGVLGFFYSLVDKIKDPNVYYESKLGNFGWFIYYLLWWSIIICIGVALTNMLPLGIFDGGRFFMLTVWAITGSKKIGEQSFKWTTYAMLALVAALMVKWVFTLF